MKRLIAAGASSLLIAGSAVAAPVCTLMADAVSGAILARDGAECGAPTTPASTFKIALALMGFDSGALTDAHAPLWTSGPDDGPAVSDQKRSVNPIEWMRDSVVWYSRRLTRTLGQEKFQRYVSAFAYGNRDLSGDSGRDNGLTGAWLSSSLLISPDGQISFLRRLWNRRLPVSADAYDKTLSIMPPFPLADGWTVYGKTGTGFRRKFDGALDRDRQIGWFVGWAIKGERTVLFARLIRDEGPTDTRAGPRARDELLAELPALLARR
ncbi:MAG: hypothetical protein BGP06_05715 [Rhizobiales bacterium 65-9]|nr:MAG: hypothetical protein BGP06_05715 [Rhizobiales bacterium 65-9]